MKKIIFFALGLMLTVGAFAQSTENAEKKELRKDIRAKRADNKEAAKDASKLKFKKAHEEREDAQAHNKDEHRHADNLKKQGVKHPISKAKHEIHEQHEQNEAAKKKED
jgi:hypothetical protein